MVGISTTMLVWPLMLVCAAVANLDPAPLPCVSPWTNLNTTSPFVHALCNSPARERMQVAVGQGTIPPWLQGTLYRNVPAQYSFGQDEVRHWFDGMGMFMGLALDAATNTVEVHSKFANTTSYASMMATQSFDYTGFDTYPYPGPLVLNSSSRRSSTRHRLRRQEAGIAAPAAKKGIIVNNDVSMVSLAGKFFATTDRAGFIEFDPNSLDTLTPENFEFFDNLSEASLRGLGLTHGPYDATTGEYYNYVSNAMPSMFGGDVEVYVYSINATAQRLNASKPWSRTTVAVVRTTNNTYAHSIGLTEQYVVWLEQGGLVVSEWDLALGTTIMDAMRDVSDSVPSNFQVIHRRTGEVHKVPLHRTDFGCIFHTGNTFEDVDGSIVYDTVAYPDCTGYTTLSIENLLTLEDEVMPGGRLTRCRIAADFSSVVCSALLAGAYASFPWFNKQFHMRPYRFAYTTQIGQLDAADEGDAGQKSKGKKTVTARTATASVRKFDLHANQTIATFQRTDYLFTEALFVPQFVDAAPTPSNEDAGALLTVAFNVKTRQSEVFAINATSMELMFTAVLPFAIPIHFHGIFCGPVPAPPTEGDDATSGAQEQFCLWN